MQSLAQKILLCCISSATWRAFHSQPEAGSGLPSAFARVWEERLGILPREWRNAERRSSRTAGGSHRCPPGRLCSPTHWRGWLGCNKHADPPTGAQDEWGSQHPSVLHSSPICPQQTIGSWYPVTEVDKHSHLRGRPMLRMQLSVGNFLVKQEYTLVLFFQSARHRSHNHILVCSRPTQKTNQNKEEAQTLSCIAPVRPKAAFKLSTAILIHFSLLLALI